MSEKSKIAAETEAYLAKIRKTVSASKSLIESARLRIAETDRMLEKQGLTREQVENITVTEEQQRLVDAELKRMGFEPLPAVDTPAPLMPGDTSGAQPREASTASVNFTAGDGDGSPENRKRKFNVMMQRFRM